METIESSMPLVVESAETEKKPKDRLVNLLDQLEMHVERLRRDAARLEEEKDTLLTTLEMLRNNELLTLLENRKLHRAFWNF